MMRIRALVHKELADLRQNPAVFLPAVLTGIVSLLLPFFVAIMVPALTGERLSDSSDFELGLQLRQDQPSLADLTAEGAVQAWIFQQFLVLLVLSPVAASMSVAAYSVIGEKQARTLEPLLVTPITTFELLTAKVMSAFVPAVVLTVGCFIIYLVGIALVARPGVYATLLSVRPLAILFVLGPLAALAALQLAVCVSSRVNDARSAQQLGALIILPIAGVLVAQISGTLYLTLPLIGFIALMLLGVNIGLMLIAIAIFDREAILTRWK